MLDWMKHKLESRLPGEISITSDKQMTPLLWQKKQKNKKNRSTKEKQMEVYSHMHCTDPGALSNK